MIKTATVVQKRSERAGIVLLGVSGDVFLPFVHPSRIKTTAASDVVLLTEICLKLNNSTARLKKNQMQIRIAKSPPGLKCFKTHIDKCL